LSTVQYWLRHAADRDLDDVDWRNRPSVPQRTGRVPRAQEDRVLRARRHLRERTALGEYGARAIHEFLRARHDDIPSVRTIGRILERRGALDVASRVRRPPPPPGWYLHDVATREAELDSFDTVMGLVIANGPEVEVLNGISVHGGVVASWPTTGVRARDVVTFLVEHWREVGLPRYAQFDNDTRFQGAHQFADAFGRVTRLCLSLGVVPVFAPPREPGFQGAIEAYNGRWQAKVWARFHHTSLRALTRRSDAYVRAHRARNALRADAAPARRPFPARWSFDVHGPLRGRVVYIRRTDGRGAVEVLGHRFSIDARWVHRLLRAEVHLDRGVIHFYALRRRAPDSQPLLHTARYQPPLGAFRGRDP